MDCDGSKSCERIFAEHQELRLRLWDFADAMCECRGRDRVEALVGYFGRFASRHFRGEEDLMRLFRFPFASAHCAEHQQFLDSFRSLRAQLAREGPSSSLVMAVNSRLCCWFVRHEEGTDRALTSFLQDGQPLPSPRHPSGRPRVSGDELRLEMLGGPTVEFR
jgi:hemerythrin-like metal-binding protein